MAWRWAYIVLCVVMTALVMGFLVRPSLEWAVGLWGPIAGIAVAGAAIAFGFWVDHINARRRARGQPDIL